MGSWQCPYLRSALELNDIAFSYDADFSCDLADLVSRGKRAEDGCMVFARENGNARYVVRMTVCYEDACNVIGIYARIDKRICNELA